MELAAIFARVFGERGDVRFLAYDGSSAGPADAPVTVELRSQRGLGYLVQSPSSLGMGRAYVAGDLEIQGDLYAAMRRLSEHEFGSISWAERWDLLRSIGLSTLKPVAPPPEEIRRPRGLRHSRSRDAQVIAHHYDVSNAFYRMVLGPSMAYTCAVYPHQDATLEQAQEEKFDLVCRKLGLRPGMRLLDVGCGWGGMVKHAVEHYGVTAIGATLSRQQAEWGQKTIADAGLAGRAEIRHSDYRDVPEAGFDAISSIGLTEHIGADGLRPYLRLMYSKLKPEGRLLNHCIMRPSDRDPLIVRRGFINRYVFPDGQLLGLGRIISAMTDTGFEVRHSENLREHYAMTLRDWGINLEANWDACVAEAGETRARIWRAYMAGSRLGFETDTIQLQQVLCVRLGEGGQSGMPLRPRFESAAVPA